MDGTLPLLHLPKEIVQVVFDYLDRPALAKVCTLNHQCYDLAATPQRWGDLRKRYKEVIQMNNPIKAAYYQMYRLDLIEGSHSFLSSTCFVLVSRRAPFRAWTDWFTFFFILTRLAHPSSL
jgi:hypothetical protein